VRPNIEQKQVTTSAPFTIEEGEVFYKLKEPFAHLNAFLQIIEKLEEQSDDLSDHFGIEILMKLNMY
jgi:hypothetical protein